MRYLTRWSWCLVLGMLAGCPEPVESVCEPGRITGCPCSNGVRGTQSCYSDGSGWSSCDCRADRDSGNPQDAIAGDALVQDAAVTRDSSEPMDSLVLFDTGTDAATVLDASQPSDAQTETDAATADGALRPDGASTTDVATPQDAGTATDGATAIDSGSPSDTGSPADAMSVDTAFVPDAGGTDAGITHLTVYALQNTALMTHPSIDTEVELSGVVVTAVDLRAPTLGFWVQETAGGKYSGIYVHKPAANLFDLSTLQRGDVVSVRGLYTEYLGQLSQIVLDTVTVTGSVAPLAPVWASDIDSDPEAWEGVLVRLQPSCEVQLLLQYGEVWTSCALLDDEIASFAVDEGQSFGYLDGIWNYAFSSYRLLPRDGMDFGPLVALDAGTYDANWDLDASLGQDANVGCSTIADLRAATPGPVNMVLCDVLVTYTRTLGFFVQAAASGPAVFVFLNPAAQGVVAGHRISLHVTETMDFENMLEVTQGAVLSNDLQIHDVQGSLRQNMSLGAGVAPGESLESELVGLSGATVVSGNNRDWVIRYGSSSVTANFYAYQGTAAGLCAGATFDLVSGYVGQGLGGYSIRSYQVEDLANVDTTGCRGFDMSNWDFEDHSTSPIPDFEYLTGSFVVTAETANPHGGSTAAALTWTSRDNQDLRAGYRSAVTVYTRYTCHFWVYDDDIAGQVRAFIHWFDASGVFLGSSFPGSGGYSINLSDWQQVQHGADAPAGAAFMSCGLRMYDDTTYWDGDTTVLVDDLSLTSP
ncbi:MAG: hypothetical protein ABIJ09_01445 [Pseudomonadota bacterium]